MILSKIREVLLEASYPFFLKSRALSGCQPQRKKTSSRRSPAEGNEYWNERGSKDSWFVRQMVFRGSWAGLFADILSRSFKRQHGKIFCCDINLN